MTILLWFVRTTLIVAVGCLGFVYIYRTHPVNTLSAGYVTRAVTITNGLAATQTNYPIETVLDTSIEIATGKMRADCGDIRAYDTNFVTPLTYAILNCNTTFTSVVFMVPSLPIGAKTTYITFGDSALATTANPGGVFDKYDLNSTTVTPSCALTGSAVWDNVNKWLQLTPSTIAANTGICNYAGFVPGTAPNRGYKAWFDSFTGTVGTATRGQGLWQYAFDSTVPSNEDNPFGGVHFTVDEGNTRMCYRAVTIGGACTATYTTTNAAISNGAWRSVKVTYDATTKQLFENNVSRVLTTLGTAPVVSNTNFGLGGRTTITRVCEHRVRNLAVIRHNELVTVSVGGNTRPVDSISFAIRNGTDTAAFSNGCDFGDLIVSAVSSCQYRLKYSTTARNGYSLQVTTSGNLTNGTDSFSNAAIGTGGGGGTLITVGTENYGVNITAGACTNGTTSLAPAFNPAGGNSVLFNPTVATTVLTCNGPNLPATNDTTNTILIDQRAAISGNTLGGLYTQSVTWTAVPNY
jgi:hypothetical protein